MIPKGMPSVKPGGWSQLSDQIMRQIKKAGISMLAAVERMPLFSVRPAGASPATPDSGDLFGS
jgi:hypothetical protein